MRRHYLSISLSLSIIAGLDPSAGPKRCNLSSFAPTERTNEVKNDGVPETPGWVLFPLGRTQLHNPGRKPKNQNLRIPAGDPF